MLLGSVRKPGPEPKTFPIWSSKGPWQSFSKLCHPEATLEHIINFCTVHTHSQTFGRATRLLPLLPLHLLLLKNFSSAPASTATLLLRLQMDNAVASPTALCFLLILLPLPLGKEEDCSTSTNLSQAIAD